MTRAKELFPGIAVALAVSVVAFVVHEQVSVISPHVVSVAFGMLGATFGRIEASFRPGLRFSAKRSLRGGIGIGLG